MMVKVRSNQWLRHTLICLFIFLKLESTSQQGMTIVEGAVAKGAVCLDGSPPAYQFDAGFGEGLHNWLIHILGGGWCNSVQDCLTRTNNRYGSSKKMKSTDYNFTGILSNKQELNPNFYNWNRVAVRYCDGSSFTGDVEAVDPATNLYFRGARVFNVIVEELLSKGMKFASNALLSGASAGGLASILHCDKFRKFFPGNTRVKCFSDAGYFAHVKDLSGGYKFEDFYNRMVTLHGSSKNLYPQCTSKMKPSLCFYPQYAIRYVKTPIFILQSAYDTFQVVRWAKLPGQVIQRTRLQVWFIRICSSILIWTCLVQLVAVGELWHPKFLTGILYGSETIPTPPPAPPPLPPPRNYISNGFLKVSCNGGLNQMRAAICDMVTVARLLNLTLVVPELDKTSFWADPSDFEDIFDVGHFIDSLRDEVRIVKRLPKRFSRKYGFQPLEMPPVSWSSEKYYLEQILPLFIKHKVIHFNRTDTRLANNKIPKDLQKLRCRVNFQALKFKPSIEALGNKLVHILQEQGPFMALHLRYEMDMLAFSGCTHGCTMEEAEELKRLRYAFPWWREKEIVSEVRRSQGLCPLTPEEATLILQALGFEQNTQIYIASGEIYGSERRLEMLRSTYPRIVKKETLLDPEELKQFQNHSSQMAALDFMVSVASNIFVPSYDGNMAKLVEGHRRYFGFKKTVQLNRRRLVELIDLHQNGTISWNEFSDAVKSSHANRMGQPIHRMIIAEKPKEEDYFYANPEECFCEMEDCKLNSTSHD